MSACVKERMLLLETLINLFSLKRNKIEPIMFSRFEWTAVKFYAPGLPTNCFSDFYNGGVKFFLVRSEFLQLDFDQDP